MKKLLLILFAFVYCLPLFAQDALLLYRQYYSKPLLVALKDITNISYDHNGFQIMMLEERNITSKSWAGVIDSLVFVDLDTLNTAQYAHYVCPDDHHPHMIDLDLYPSILWSCCNVGASAPEEYGGYYAWGETEEKDYYDWETYKCPLELNSKHSSFHLKIIYVNAETECMASSSLPKAALQSFCLQQVLVIVKDCILEMKNVTIGLRRMMKIIFI